MYIRLHMYDNLCWDFWLKPLALSRLRHCLAVNNKYTIDPFVDIVAIVATSPKGIQTKVVIFLYAPLFVSGSGARGCGLYHWRLQFAASEISTLGKK